MHINCRHGSWFLLAILLCGCPQPKPASPPLPLSVAVSTGFPASCPILLAQHRGDFRRQGVAVTIKSMPSGVQALNSLLAGEVELATVSDVHFALNALEGKPVRLVAALARYNGGTELVLRSGTADFAGRNLAGKRIGVTQRSAGHYALGIILARHGLRESDIRLVNLPPQDMPAAIRNGVIDGAVTWEPFLSRTAEAVADVPNVRYSTGELYVGNWLLVGRAAQLEKNRAAVEAALKAMDDAATDCVGEKAPGRRMMVDQNLLSEDEAKRAWIHFRFDVTLDQGLILALEDQAIWGERITPQSTGASINFLKFLDAEPMRRALPDNITVIQ